MGLFDYVHCEHGLPCGGLASELRTKDFDDPRLEHYTIRANGRLIHLKPRYATTPDDEYCGEVDKNFHGFMSFYAVGSNCRYKAKFTDGNLEYIELLDNALPIAPPLSP